MGKFIAGLIGFIVGFEAKTVLVSILHYEASQGDEEAKNLVNQYVEVGDKIHDILK